MEKKLLCILKKYETHYACMFGNIEMVKLLLDNGSDKNIQNDLEKMPLELQLTHPAKIKRR